MTTPRGGRPSLFTSFVRDRIVEMVRKGNYRHVAAAAVGVHKNTLVKWMARGRREPDSEYGRFFFRVLEAEAEAHCEMVTAITAKASEDPKQAQWYLERKYPELWAGYRKELQRITAELRDLRSMLSISSTPANAHAADGHTAEDPPAP